jgi:hypothetical protein
MELVDSMECQEGSRSIPYCQVGRDEQMSWEKPEELIEQVSLEMNLDQHVQLTEEEDLRSLMMIGGIEIFLPLAQEEEEICVVGATTTEEQSAETVKEELEQVLETAPEAYEEENEHSEECLNAFNQEAEEAVALKLTAEEAEEDDEHSEEWLSIFSQETEKTATWEFATEEEEEADNICFADLWKQIEALERRVIVQGVHIQQVKLEVDEEEGMGDHDDLPNCRKFLQLRRLQKQDQPLEQLDEVIEEIRRLMLRSAETASKEQLSRKEEAIVAAARKQQQGNGADEQLQRMILDPGGFQHQRWEAHEQELMNFAAEEYDVGESLHVIQPANQPCQAHTFKAEERRNPHLKLELIVI